MIGLLAVMLSSARAMGSPPGMAEKGRTVYRDLMIPFAALLVAAVLIILQVFSSVDSLRSSVLPAAYLGHPRHAV